MAKLKVVLSAQPTKGHTLRTTVVRSRVVLHRAKQMPNHIVQATTFIDTFQRGVTLVRDSTRGKMANIILDYGNLIVTGRGDV